MLGGPVVAFFPLHLGVSSFKLNIRKKGNLIQGQLLVLVTPKTGNPEVLDTGKKMEATMRILWAVV